MYSPQILNVNFEYQGKEYNISLVEGEKSEHTVKINGKTYSVIGEKEKLDTACAILKSTSLDSILDSEDLKNRLSFRGDLSFPPVKKTDGIGTRTLKTNQPFHAWKQDEEKNLDQSKRYVAKEYWRSREYRTDHSSLRGFLGGDALDQLMKENDFDAFFALFNDLSADEEKSLDGPKLSVAKSYWNSPEYRIDHSSLRKLLGEKAFDQILKKDDLDAFLTLFKDLSTDELWDVRNNANCQPLNYVKETAYTITSEDLQNVRDYLDDIGFSGSVTLSDAHGTYHISPTGQENEKTPFSIGSISKVFTGTLALLTMDPDDFKKPLQLNPTTLSYLEKNKKPVFDHLSKPSLLQAMNHDGGFGDYLRNYEKELVEAYKPGESQPVKINPEEFLKFAETTLHPLDAGIYSNLGILLVGLAVQHKQNKPFDQLLEELILIPAKVNISATKPTDGKFSETDPCHGLAVGSPSGGHWATSNELIKMGTWLQEKCIAEPEFKAKMDNFGREFYDPDDQEIRHNGCSAAGSSFLSSFIQSGVSTCVLSDQGNYTANRVYYKIREKLIERNN